MEEIVEYITLNYTWIIVISIVILLAIIGYYADKTNFWQGEKKVEEPIDDDTLEKLPLKRINECINKSSSKENNQANEELGKNTNYVDNEVINHQNITNNISEDIDNQILNEQEKKLKNFNKEFEEILPRKPIIDNELLEEIDNLSIDKTQKLNLNDIPDVDDVELPKIKEMETIEDIWKF